MSAESAPNPVSKVERSAHHVTLNTQSSTLDRSSSHSTISANFSTLYTSTQMRHAKVWLASPKQITSARMSAKTFVNVSYTTPMRKMQD